MDLVIAIIGLAVVMLAHLAGFIWWAATLTNRVTHIESWMGQNNRISDRISVMEVQVSSILSKSDDISRSISKLYDRLETKADKN